MSKSKTICSYNDPLPSRLRLLLDEHDITIQALADHVGVTRQGMSQYQDGSSQPSLAKLIAIAKYFNVSTDWLLGLSDIRTTETETRAVCQFTGLSEKALSSVASCPNPEIMSKIMETEEFWDMVACFSDAVLNKQYLDPSPIEMCKTFMDRKNGINIPIEYRVAYQRLFMRGLRSSYKQEISELFYRLFDKVVGSIEEYSESSIVEYLLKKEWQHENP